MVKITNIAKEFLGSKIDITLPKNPEYGDEEWELELNLQEQDKIDIVDAIRRAEEDNANAKEILKEQDSVLKRILERSYTGVLPPEQIDNIIMKRGPELILELSFKFGIRDRRAYEALLKKKEQQIKDFMEGKNITESSQPQKETQN